LGSGFLNEDLYIEIVESIIDFANAVESACVNLRLQIEGKQKLGQPSSKKWNPGKIRWVESEGFKGPFEKSEDFNNLEFKHMLKDLAAHNGKLSRNGFFYWVYRNGSTVGRKKREVKR
jgi:hypothetical protein